MQSPEIPLEKFNVRVYALIFRNDEVLLADESINAYEFSKFPGGGVELGEGLADALKRELMEEGNIELQSAQHFYTTDFFQRSGFRKNEQIVSVYYIVKADIEWNEFISDQSQGEKQHMVKLYFRKLKEIEDADITFPIDKLVLSMLKAASPEMLR